jgi:hypothetical protein
LAERHAACGLSGNGETLQVVKHNAERAIADVWIYQGDKVAVVRQQIAGVPLCRQDANGGLPAVLPIPYLPAD